MPLPVKPNCFGNSAPMYGPLLSKNNSEFSSNVRKFVITSENNPPTSNVKSKKFLIYVIIFNW